MQLDRYTHEVQQQLIASAALGDDRVRDVAATLASAASPAIRLAVLGAVAAAAEEITAALLDSPGAPAVAVQLDAGEIRIAVTTTAVEPVPLRPDESDVSARISLRLSDGLKAEIDAAAARAGVSVNTWLVRAATTALASPVNAVGGPAERSSGNSRHITGWING